MANSMQLFQRRRERTRNRLRRLNRKRPRLSIFRSGRHIYAQIVDDDKGVTLASASTTEKDTREGTKSGADKSAAEQVGRRVAERAIEVGVKDVIFDRGGYKYHGRVKALADAAREIGLSF